MFTPVSHDLPRPKHKPRTYRWRPDDDAPSTAVRSPNRDVYLTPPHPYRGCDDDDGHHRHTKPTQKQSTPAYPASEVQIKKKKKDLREQRAKIRNERLTRARGRRIESNANDRSERLIYLIDIHHLVGSSHPLLRRFIAVHHAVRYYA